MNVDGFRSDLESLINRHSMENGSNSPDFILATYLASCLRAFDTAVSERERWYGRGVVPCDPPGLERHEPDCPIARFPNHAGGCSCRSIRERLSPGEKVKG